MISTLSGTHYWRLSISLKWTLSPVMIRACSAILTIFKQAGVKLIAGRIETHEQFEQYKALGFDYFQEYFFALSEVIRRKKLPTSKVSLLQLIAASASADFDFELINKIIERNVAFLISYCVSLITPLLIKKLNQELETCSDLHGRS